MRINFITFRVQPITKLESKHFKGILSQLWVYDGLHHPTPKYLLSFTLHMSIILCMRDIETESH